MDSVITFLWLVIPCVGGFHPRNPAVISTEAGKLYGNYLADKSTYHVALDGTQYLQDSATAGWPVIESQRQQSVYYAVGSPQALVLAATSFPLSSSLRVGKKAAKRALEMVTAKEHAEELLAQKSAARTGHSAGRTAPIKLNNEQRLQIDRMSHDIYKSLHNGHEEWKRKRGRMRALKQKLARLHVKEKWGKTMLSEATEEEYNWVKDKLKNSKEHFTHAKNVLTFKLVMDMEAIIRQHGFTEDLKNVLHPPSE